MNAVMSSFLLTAFTLFIANVSTASSNDGELYFLADVESSNVYQVCTLEDSLARCLTNQDGGVSRIWKLGFPYLAYEVRNKNSSTIYFLNTRTGISSRKATVTALNMNGNNWVSPAGDRWVSVESAPFGSILVIQGIFLDNSHTIVSEINADASVYGWVYPDDVLYLREDARILSIDLESPDHREALYSTDNDSITVSEFAVSKNGSELAVVLTDSGRQYLEFVSDDDKKLIDRASGIVNPYIYSKGERIVYVVQESNPKSAIRYYDVVSGKATSSIPFPYDVRNPIIVGESL